MLQDTASSLSEPDSNFVQLLDALLKEHNKFSIHTIQYTSPAVQNELIALMANQVLRNILEDISERKLFSIMLDESSDRSNREQMCFLLRLVNSFDYVIWQSIHHPPKALAQL